MSTTEKTTKPKAAGKKKAVTKKKAATKKTVAKKKASTRQKASPSTAKPAKVTTVKTSDIPGMHPVLPYAIAATFIFLTAGLTMLMTSLLGETDEAIRELEDATESIQGSPSLLVEARDSFIKPAQAPTETPAASDTPTAMTMQSAPITASSRTEAPVITDTVSKKIDETMLASVPPAPAPKTERVVSSARKPSPVVEDVHIAKSRERANQIFSMHQQRVAEIRKRLHENADKREQQIEAYITAQIKTLNEDISRIEESLRPLAPAHVVEAYQKMIDKRREVFNRRMEERQKLLQEIRQRRSELRQRYTQLIKEMAAAQALS
jgi:hypothetical protein